MEYSSGQSCSTRPPNGLGQEGKGWVLHYCCNTLWRPLVVHVAMHLAQAFGSTSLHKCEYLSAHMDMAVCAHMGVGV